MGRGRNGPRPMRKGNVPCLPSAALEEHGAPGSPPTGRSTFLPARIAPHPNGGTETGDSRINETWYYRRHWGTACLAIACFSSSDSCSATSPRLFIACWRISSSLQMAATIIQK